MPAKKTPISKSNFIRHQPSTLSAAEVVAKAKAAGVTILPGLVYEVRRTAKLKKGTAKKTTTAKPTVTSKAAPAKSKADFVRAHSGLAPKDVVAKAKAAGLKFDVRYVYRVRAYDKTGGKKKPTKATAPAKRPSAPNVKPTTNRATPRMAPPVPRPITTALSAENLLKALGAELGLGRAIEILAGERARVQSILRG
jgi:hypothetical protein